MKNLKVKKKILLSSINFYILELSLKSTDEILNQLSFLSKKELPNEV